ncbi:MAG: cytochrome c biogenesis heme-transporting ATPase CcmA [Gammaproteobacteria bacterium]|nr:cytochrome c biogenesis heme-transporting ATPase CcmA [Gammaproteobacteria bacterium]
MLQAENLTCERNRQVLFQELSFTCGPGETLAINGANGAGKTTLLRILAGLYEDYEGDVDWQLEEYPMYVGHKSGVKDLLTPYENLSWAAELYNCDITREELEEALQAVALRGNEDVNCGALSQGQRKRVCLARLFLLDNPVWILDEPFSAIDTKGVEILEARMLQHIDAGGLVIMASHQPVSFACSQIINLGSS